MPAKDMAAYMRSRRARQRAEREAAEREAVVIDCALPRDALKKASAAELATVKEKIAAIGSGAVITKTDGRLNVVSREAFEARQGPPAASTPLLAPKPGAHFPSPPAARPRAASPRSSVIVCGGTPGTGRPVPGYDPTFVPHEPSAIRWQLHLATMTSAHAAKIAAQERRADEAKRRVKAMEARATEISQGFFGALQLLLNVRLTAR
jgi:hypothetical protein